jgi:hypothetical protein
MEEPKLEPIEQFYVDMLKKTLVDILKENRRKELALADLNDPVYDGPPKKDPPMRVNTEGDE